MVLGIEETMRFYVCFDANGCTHSGQDFPGLSNRGLIMLEIRDGWASIAQRTTGGVDLRSITSAYYRAIRYCDNMGIKGI